MSLLRAFATVGSYTMMSRVLGFVRDILVAATLGAGPVADAFFVAFKLPNFFRRLFAEGAFNAGFVPLFSGLLETEGRVSARIFAEQALAVLLATLFVFVTAIQIGMPWVMLVLAPGFADDPAKFDLAVTFTRLTFPYLLFVSLVSLLGGVLNSLQRFAAVAATPILLNLCLITAITLVAPYMPTAGHALSWGVAAAGMVQFLWLVLACQRVGIRLRLPRPRMTAKVKELLLLMLPAAVGAGAVQINLVVDIILASLLPEGSVSYLFYADRLNQLPIGVVGVAVGTALLPMLSRQVAANDGDGAIRSLNRSIEMVLFLTLPAAAAMVTIPFELITTLFQRGQFGAHETTATAYALVAFSVGLPAYVLVKVLTPAYFARRDTRTPVIIGAIAMVVNIVLNVILMQFLLHVGLALSTAIAAWVNIAMLAIGLHRRGHLKPDAQLIRRLSRTVVATIIMVAVLIGLSTVLAPGFAGGEAARVPSLAILVAAGMASFAVAAVLSGAATLDDLKRLTRRRRGRGDKTA
jgi:putative peptidoglycan lipid II flippase